MPFVLWPFSIVLLTNLIPSPRCDPDCPHFPTRAEARLIPRPYRSYVLKCALAPGSLFLIELHPFPGCVEPCRQPTPRRKFFARWHDDGFIVRPVPLGLGFTALLAVTSGPSEYPSSASCSGAISRCGVTACSCFVSLVLAVSRDNYSWILHHPAPLCCACSTRSTFSWALDIIFSHVRLLGSDGANFSMISSAALYSRSAPARSPSASSGSP